MNLLQRSDSHEKFQLSPIKAIELAASRIPGAVSLAQGIPSFQTPQVIRDFAIEKVRQGLCDKYSLTTGLAELREEISLSLSKEGLSYDPETEIIVTAGAIEGITATLLACTNPGDQIIVPSPTYASYMGSLAIAECSPCFVDLDEERNFDFHVEKIERAVTRKTKGILFCSPNNPTGTLFSEEKIRRLVALADERDLLIIVDEVYKDFYYTGHKHFSPAAVAGARTKVVRVCSFSKAFAMTGWRVGFVHTDAALSARILKYHDAMVTCAPVVSQYAAIAALRFGDPFLAQFRDELKRRRDYVIEQLDQLSHVMDYQTPQATYFVFPRIKDTVRFARDSTKLAYDLLEKARVALVPGVAFGPSGESHLRINYGRETKDLEEGMARIAEYFSGARVTRKIPASHSPDSSMQSESALGALARKTLAVAARIYIARRSPVIVGIVGTLGKTVFKRTIHDLLKSHCSTRTNILSYNTEIGLPLSVLDLRIPRSLGRQLLFPFEVAWKALFANDGAKLLVLEYGISSARDAHALLRIAEPSWLVIAGLSSADPSIQHREITAGVKLMAERVRVENILWCGDDPLVQEIGIELAPRNCLNPASLSNEKFNTGENSYIVSRELVGRSSSLALIAAIRLAEEFKMPSEALQKFLSSQ